METAEEIVEDFIQDFGLADRPQDYHVAYSALRPRPVLLVGDNPGGDPENPATIATFKEYYAPGEHEFIDQDYLLARAMRRLFNEAFEPSGIDVLRGVPVTNASFFRTPRQPPARVIRQNRERCAPYLWRIVQLVGPSLIVANGVGVFQYLSAYLANAREVESPLPAYYRKLRGAVDALGGNEITLVGFYHLTGYRWSKVNSPTLPCACAATGPGRCRRRGIGMAIGNVCSAFIQS